MSTILSIAKNNLSVATTVLHRLGKSCQELKTKLEDNITCDRDSDCPSDSTCECNGVTGDAQCVPLPYSDKKGYEYDIKGDLECEDCDEKLSLVYAKAWCTMYEPYDDYCMCLGDYPLPDEPSSSASKTGPDPTSPSASSTKGNTDSALAIKLSATLIFAVVAAMTML